ncbi:MAG: tail-specific protease, partial [Flavobacteriaceae bacterium]|nr:tail-specific protease [Flavobacteriaceae bacterium]
MKKIIHFMKRNYKIIIPIVILAGLLFSFQITNKPDPEKDKILIGLIRYALTKGHYEPHQINDEFSEQVFIDFIDALDPYKRFFIQNDIDEFSKYKYLIDDQLKNEEFTFYSFVFERYNQRVLESKKYYKEILKTPFDFEKEGTFNIDYDEKSFAKSKAELIKTWQLQLKVSTLSRLHEKIELQESFSEKSVSEKSDEHKMINGEVVEIFKEK